MPDTKRLHTHYFFACQISPGTEIRTHANLDGKQTKLISAAASPGGRTLHTQDPGLDFGGERTPHHAVSVARFCTRPAVRTPYLRAALRQAARAPTARSPLAADSRVFMARLT